MSPPRRIVGHFEKLFAALAQSGEHSNVTAEVRGSKPLCRANIVEKKEKRMYNVEYKAGGVACERECVDLNEAMDFAKEINCLVIIKGNGMEIVGKFGADSIVDGVCPDGVAYTWMKRRNQ